MIVSIDVFIFALSPAASVLASAIFLYESVITDSNCGACSSVMVSVVFHFASASLAFSSGDLAVAPEVDAALVEAVACVKGSDTMASAKRETAPKRTHFMTHLLRGWLPHACGR